MGWTDIVEKYCEVEWVLRQNIGPFGHNIKAKKKIFLFNSRLVWLFADPVLFVEHGGKSLIKVRNGINAKVFLWELDICESKFAKKHPEFEGVFVCSVSTQ